MNAIVTPAVSIEALEAGTIDPRDFNHESHVYAAWLYLECWPLDDAIGRFCGALRRLTAQLGVPGKYHETISWFFLILINQRRANTGPTSWFEFRRDNDDLVSGGAKTLGRYYSKELLESDHARNHFLLPDKLSLLES